MKHYLLIEKEIELESISIDGTVKRIPSIDERPDGLVWGIFHTEKEAIDCFYSICEMKEWGNVHFEDIIVRDGVMTCFAIIPQE